MTRSALLRTAAVAALALLLLTSPAALAQGWSPATQKGDDGWLASVWTFLADLFLSGEALDTRCTIDPNGCAGGGAHLDTRCGIDPNGSCESGF